MYRELEKAIEYSFKDPTLLEEALTHPSYGKTDYQRLEFLGDSVIGFIVSEWLFKEFPLSDEGKLSKLKHYLVSKKNLACWSSVLNLHNYIKVGRSLSKENISEHLHILADTFEALTAAIYLDGGIENVRKLINKLLETHFEVEKIDLLVDPKNELIKFVSKNNLSCPEYNVVSISGPNHKKVYEVECRVGEVAVTKESSSKKEAENEAAREILTILKACQTTKNL